VKLSGFPQFLRVDRDEEATGAERDGLRDAGNALIYLVL